MLTDTLSNSPFDADSTLTFLESPTRRRLNKVVAVLGVGVYVVYLVYRALFTINPNAIVFSLLVYGAEVHGLLSLCFYFFQAWELRGRQVPPPPANLSVDVFITTYNEDLTILRQTIRAAVAMTYPHTTYVLDDGRRAEVAALAAELGCRYLTRSTNEHAKAGNWNNAFRQTSGDVIATFDADHAPRADFLVRTLGFFRDPKVALVQVPQRYHNVDSMQHRIDWKNRRMFGEQDVFFKLMCPGKDHWNAAFFCGTGAVLRRAALEPRGGLETGSITEDMHTSLVLHSTGWKSVYLDELLVTGLAPMDFQSFQAQRLRWAEGNLKIIKSINPVTAPGLTPQQRICYGASMYHWTTGVPKLIFYLAPPWMLFTGTYPVVNFDATFVALYLSFLTALVVSYRVLSRGHGRLLMDEVFNMATAFTLNRAVKRLLVGRGRPSVFVVTEKNGTRTPDVGNAMPYFALVAFSLLAMEWGALSIRFGVVDDLFGTGAAAFWTAFNLGMMWLVLEMALRPPQKRETCRFPAACAVVLSSRPGESQEIGMTANLSPTGCELLSLTSLPIGSTWPLSIRLGDHAFECVGEVTAVRRKREGVWQTHGVRFVHLSQAQTDFLNDALLNLVVPRLFDRLSQPSRLIRWLRKLALWLGDSYAKRPRRSSVDVPVRITSSQGDIVTMMYDVSSRGFGVVAPRPISVGTPVTVTVLSASPWSVQASVVRTQALAATQPQFQTWLLGLQVEGGVDGAAVADRVAHEAAA